MLYIRTFLTFGHFIYNFLINYFLIRKSVYINFYKIADDEKPFHVQWYGSKDAVICGHEKFNEDDNKCPRCDGLYNEGEE